MRRFLFVVVSIAIGAAPALAKPRRPPPLTCEKSSSRHAARDAEWAKFTSQSFTDALAREQLTMAQMVARTLRPDDKLLAGVRAGTTFTFGTGTSAAQALYVGNAEANNVALREFVTDAQGVIHPLARKENLIGSESVTLCGCGRMGGGMAPPRVAIIYVLPAGATYDATPIELAYDAKHVYTSFRNVVNGQLAVCPLPP